MDTLRVGPHDAVPGAQHPQKPEVFKWKKSMDDFFHGQLEQPYPRAAFYDFPEEARNHTNAREMRCFLAANTHSSYDCVRRSGLKPMHSTGLHWHSGVFHSLSGETATSFALCLPRRGEIILAVVAPAKIHRRNSGVGSELQLISI